MIVQNQEEFDKLLLQLQDQEQKNIKLEIEYNKLQAKMIEVVNEQKKKSNEPQETPILIDTSIQTS